MRSMGVTGMTTFFCLAVSGGLRCASTELEVGRHGLRIERVHKL